jgi:pilus assembly protein CpaC
VVEFPVSELREIGVKWGATGGAAFGGIWAPSSQGNPNEFGLTIANGPVSAAGSGASLAYPAAIKLLSAVNMGIDGKLNLLAQNGKLTVLAEPQLSARNGSKASFLAGGEFPYSVSSANGTTVMFKPYGIKLEITPHADRNGLIRATIESEVSNIDTSITTTAGPALSTRKTSTEFNVKSGETLVLSGLVSRKTSTTIDKVPGLGDIPILGALFRSTRFMNDETELVVFVTPTVVDSHSPGLVDRVKRTNEKLQDRLGTTPPSLSEPLQPNHDPAKTQDVQEVVPLADIPVP